MDKNMSSRQMINNEIAARASNTKTSQSLKHHIPATEQASSKILFNCECSDNTCEDRVALTLDEYDQLHQNKAQFIIVKGHYEPTVEKITQHNDTLAVVEKYAL